MPTENEIYLFYERLNNKGLQSFKELDELNQAFDVKN